MVDATLLLILQSCSFTVSVLLALMLLASRIHQPNTSLNYEKSRWMLFSGMLIFAVHYFLQMFFGFRARSEELGAMVNILFYTPVAYLLSYASMRLASDLHHRAMYVGVSITSYILIVGCLVAGWYFYGSIHMPVALKAIGVVFFISVLILIIYPTKELQRVSRQIQDETGGDIRQFNIYMGTSTLLLYSLGIIVPFAIFSNIVLAILGPVYLLVICFYVISFISLGFNFSQVGDLIDADNTAENDNNTDEPASLLSEECKAATAQAIDKWRKEGGYSQADTNSTNLAQKLRIPKRQLIAYLLEEEGKTFRVWLSELRIEEAKRMLIEDKNYKLETIATACGFSHRNYLQNRFKAITGLTPREWQEHHQKD